MYFSLSLSPPLPLIKLPYHKVSNFETARVHEYACSPLDWNEQAGGKGSSIKKLMIHVHGSAPHKRFPAPANSNLCVCLDFKNFMPLSFSMYVSLSPFSVFTLLCPALIVSYSANVYTPCDISRVKARRNSRYNEKCRRDKLTALLSYRNNVAGDK